MTKDHWIWSDGYWSLKGFLLARCCFHGNSMDDSAVTQQSARSGKAKAGERGKVVPDQADTWQIIVVPSKLPSFLQLDIRNTQSSWIWCTGCIQQVVYIIIPLVGFIPCSSIVYCIYHIQYHYPVYHIQSIFNRFWIQLSSLFCTWAPGGQFKRPAEDAALCWLRRSLNHLLQECNVCGGFHGAPPSFTWVLPCHLLVDSDLRSQKINMNQLCAMAKVGYVGCLMKPRWSSIHGYRIAQNQNTLW